MKTETIIDFLTYHSCWNIDDVKEVRADLTDDQAREVLQYVDLHYDCNYLITLETLKNAAFELFGAEVKGKI